MIRRRLAACLLTLCAASAVTAQTYRAVTVNTNGVLVAPSNFVETNNLITVIGTPADGEVVAWSAAVTNHVYSSAGAGDMLKAAYDADDDGLVDGIEVSALTTALGGSMGGDIWYAGVGTFAATVLVPGTPGQVLVTGGAGAAPAWADVQYTMVVPWSEWRGPLPSDGVVGWEYNDQDDASTVMTLAGLTTTSATQQSGTLRATAMLPRSATNWAETAALELDLLAESTTTTDCRYIASAWTMTTNAVGKVQVYGPTTNAFSSTTDPTVFRLNRSDLGTFVPGGRLTLEIILQTRAGYGAYVGQPRLEVVK